MKNNILVFLVSAFTCTLSTKRSHVTALTPSSDLEGGFQEKPAGKDSCIQSTGPLSW